MRYIAGLFLLLASVQWAQAKKVKFSVNLTGQVVNVATGIHVMGDFQTAAGYSGGDWACNTILMAKEPADTNIWSVVVDIPAFQKYEYKFVNGDQCYEVEIVPLEAQVGYNFVDNRWIYIDSLANDTTDIGAMMFSGNAPKDKYLIRPLVDMVNQTVSPNGVHLAASFQSWNPTTQRMYSFANGGSKVYETQCYVDLMNYEYKFYNGNTTTDAEIVPGSCATNSNRAITMSKDTVLPNVCFSDCQACFATTVSNTDAPLNLKVFPNPSSDILHIQTQQPISGIRLNDLSGRVILQQNQSLSSSLNIPVQQYPHGMYTLEVLLSNGDKYIQKIILQ
ncbi:MAG: T9SS type A sorting domain-containing protein [Chitinophagaceae bacterium]|nr:T9SS type A sorting domain-containing protein [Chitinophagaceae bacterium]